MATDQVGDSRDIGSLLQGELQVLETIATGAPVAAAPGALRRVDRVPRRRNTRDAGRRAASSSRVASSHAFTSMQTDVPLPKDVC